MTKDKKQEDQQQLVFEEQFFGQWTEGDVEVCHVEQNTAVEETSEGTSAS